MKRRILIAIFGLFVSILFSNNNPQIHFSADKNTFPAKYWKEFIVKGEFKLHSLSEYKKAKANIVVNDFLQLYPQNFIDANLKNIFVLDSCEKFGLLVGGTPLYYESSIIVVYYDTTLNFSTQLFSGLVHEFSHLIHFGHSKKFNTSLWKQCNQKKYGKGGYSAIKNGSDSDTLNEEYCKEGFLNQYSTSSIEEDFATFSEKIFTTDSSFWNIEKKHPLISKKKNLLTEFYHSLNPDFTEEYFRNLPKPYN